MIDWSQTEKYYDLGNTAGFAMSLLEAEKILRALLDEKKVKGRTYEEKLEQMKPYLSAPNNFQHARSLVLQLVDLQLPKKISQQTAENILQTYFTVCHEIQNLSGAKIRKANWVYYLNAIKKKLFIFLLFIVVFITAIAALGLFLSETKTGGDIVNFVIEYSRTIFYQALPLLLILLTIAAVGVGISLHSIKKHKHKKEKHPKHLQADEIR